ncbi:hypothetical protein ACFPPD_06700 [Cohnella suwonensis]|uniref:Uncharacterized protein n=1 Tax=Cohnella suwonensis TaxID=696072 RepID=A0ABW0LR77_9BACL
MDGRKHYIRVNEDGTIVYGFSSAFEEPQEGDIVIFEDGPRHFHEAFSEPLTNDRGQFRFKWTGQVVERSQQELDDEWAARPPASPTVEERLEATEQALLAMMEAMI